LGTLFPILNQKNCSLPKHLQNFKIALKTKQNELKNKHNGSLAMVLESKYLQHMPYKTQNYINKIICREESFKDLPLHWFFINDSITNTSSITKVGIMVSKSQCIAHLPQRPNVEN
jgi:hypothetical protein